MGRSTRAYPTIAVHAVTVSFIKCPFCSGHEAVSPEAADVIAALIEKYTRGSVVFELETELLNIRNHILNAQERTAEVDPLLT